MTKPYLTPAEAAELLSITREMLMQSDAPRSTFGPRTIRFHRESLMAWAEAKQRNGTEVTREQRQGAPVVLRILAAIPEGGMTRYEVEFPFARVECGLTHKEGRVIRCFAWKPSVATSEERDGYDVSRCYKAHGMGRMIITEIARIRPEGYHERVIYTRTWIDPDGNAMGKPRKLLMTSTGAFRSLIAGYRHPFEMAERERDDV